MYGIDADVPLPSGERYRVTVLSSAEELDASFRLRHRIYVDSLGWVPASPDGREIDQYDGWATSLGVFGEEDRLLGVVRLLPSYGPMMIEHEFAGLFEGSYNLIREPIANEITRLAIDPGERRQGEKSKILLALLRGMYRWLTEQSVRYSYMVVEKRVLRMLRTMGFPGRPLGPAIAFPPAHALTVAAVLDWNEFREQNARLRPWFLEWMSEGAAPIARPLNVRSGAGRQALHVACQATSAELVVSALGGPIG
ncbi:MAG: GNAT family N-acetyltransferase [Nitrospiraceae bacterium]|nr:GNAT family N-acetyltransferase [Nitrospiraceae bacterium]